MSNNTIMKQIGLFLIFLITPFILSKTKAQVLDSLQLFESITDIEKLIQQGSPQNQPPPVVVPANQQRRDTVFTQPQIPLLRKNPLDSLYRRKANGTLQLPDNLYNQRSLSGLTFRDTIFYNPLLIRNRLPQYRRSARLQLCNYLKLPSHTHCLRSSQNHHCSGHL